jgi:hypothetical protein
MRRDVENASDKITGLINQEFFLLNKKRALIFDARFTATA